jgi:hypothetical protein
MNAESLSRYAVAIIAAALLTVSARAAPVWSETDIDLATLLEYDFRLVDTSFVMLDQNQSIEVLYLIKDQRLFRCFTFEAQGQDPRHWCETIR